VKESTATARSSRRWPAPPGHVLPTVILVLFLALSTLAFLRAGETLRGRFEEMYVAASRVIVSHIESRSSRDEWDVSDIQYEIDALSKYDENVLGLEYLASTEDGRLEVAAANDWSNLNRPATDLEARVAATGACVRNWSSQNSDYLLEMTDPVHNPAGDVIGCVTWRIAATPTKQDEEAMLFAVGFVLLLLVMIVYYFQQFRRMRAYYSEKDRTAVELRRLSAAVSQSANMIAVTDVDGVIEYVNPRFCELTGYTPEEAVGQRSNLLKSGTHPQEFYRELWETITAKRTWTGQVQNRRKNGELYWERKTISPVIDDLGKIQSYISVGEDITIELRAQQQIIEKDKMSAVGMLAAGVAHEFKNYLGGIMGNASLALEDIDKPEGLLTAREALELVVNLSEKANKVAMSLLTYSRSRPDVVGAENIRRIIEQSLSLVSKEMASRSIQVATYFEEVPRLEVSASKIQQLLLNLLINAAHAVKEDGVITIALFNAGDAVKIVVGDSGSGIAPEHINRVFDPFYSSKGVWGKDNVVGTGMGLPICRNIVREYHGDLTVESVLDIGTAFTVIIPIENTTESTLTPRPATGRSLRFLIFTMDKSIVSSLHAEASATGVKLMTADNFAAVPRDLRDAADLVVCDARFPAKGELLHMTDACDTSGIPFVTIFGDQLEYPTLDVRERGAANFSNLPMVRELIAVVDRFCRQQPGKQGGQKSTRDDVTSPA